MPDRRQAGDPLRFGPFELDLRARELRSNGRRIRLQDKPFEVLASLVERPGEIVTREELRRRLWPADTFVVFDDSLNSAIRKAREALGDAAESPRFIETIPRRGYRFIAPVSASGPASPSVEPPAAPPAVLPVDSRLEPPPTRRRTVLVAVAAIGAVVLAIAIGLRISGSGAPAAAMVRFQLQAPRGARLLSWVTGLTLSPDGRQIAFAAVPHSDRVERIWVQTLHSSSVRQLAGSEGGSPQCWSPDGNSIAYTAYGRLMRHDLRTGIAEALGEAATLGVACGEAGILYGREQGQGLYLRSPTGDRSEALTTLDAARDETVHAWPQWLPDGRSFIYLALSRQPQHSGVYLGRLGDPARRLLLATSHRVVYSPPGFLLFAKNGGLLAQRFRLDTGTLEGTAAEVAHDVYTYEANGSVAVTVEGPGLLAYGGRSRPPRREVMWVDRAGRRIGTPHPPDHIADFSLSPDGRLLVLQASDPDGDPPSPDLWLLELARGLKSRVVTGPGHNEGGAWAPDSRRFAYARHRGLRLPADLYLKDVRQPETDRPLLVDDSGSKHPFDWSADGRWLLYGLMRPDSPRQDIWVLPIDEQRAPFSWLATGFDEAEARFSPDGRWVAYESDETGRREIFVRSFAEPAVRVQISTNGGTRPQWRRDGREIYYVAGDHQLTTVPLSEGPELEPASGRALFELRRLEPNPSTPTPYAVSTDGARFLIGAVVDEGGGSPVTVVLNWTRLFDQ